MEKKWIDSSVDFEIAQTDGNSVQVEVLRNTQTDGNFSAGAGLRDVQADGNFASGQGLQTAHADVRTPVEILSNAQDRKSPAVNGMHNVQDDGSSVPVQVLGNRLAQTEILRNSQNNCDLVQAQRLRNAQSEGRTPAVEILGGQSRIASGVMEPDPGMIVQMTRTGAISDPPLPVPLGGGGLPPKAKDDYLSAISAHLQGLSPAHMIPYNSPVPQGIPYFNQSVFVHNMFPFKFICDWPGDNIETDFSEECQGVTHDNTWGWYFSQKHRIVKWTDLLSLTKCTPQWPWYAQGIPSQFQIPSNRYNHFADLDYYNGFIYVPLEDTKNKKTPMIVAFDTKSTKFSWCYLESWNTKASKFSGSAPWCAINPKGVGKGELFTSRSDDVQYVHCYERHIKKTIYRQSGEYYDLQLKHKKSYRLVDGLRRGISFDSMQGGAFSDKGHLYICSNAPHTALGNGIYGFFIDDVNDELQLMQFIPVPRDWSGRSAVEYDELEGLTIRDMGDVFGQIHLVMLHNEGGAKGDDDITFKHIWVDAKYRSLI